MSVSNELVRVSASATSLQTVFPFTNILIFEAGDLRVFQNGTQLSLGADYTVSLSGTAPSDGSVTLVTGATSGDIILIERDIPRRQATVYNPGTAFPAKSHENALDKLTLEISDLHNRVNYSPIFARGRDENISWQFTNMPDAVTAKIPVYDPSTKLVSWSDTGAPTSSLAFSALTGTLDISGDDIRIEEVTKSYANAVSRTMREYLDDYKSVKDFGAVGDGITDDTTAIRNAVATSGKIHFPEGDYLVSGSITVASNTAIQGAGVGVTRIFSNTNHSFFIGTDKSNIEISHMTIEGIHPGGTGSNTTFDAIDFLGSTPTQRHFHFHHLYIKNMTGRGIVTVRHCSDIFVHDNMIENCLIGIFLFGGNIRTVTHQNILLNERIGGIYIDDATVGGVAGVDAFQPFYHTVSSNVIKNSGFDPVQSGFGIAVSASIGVTVSDNVIDGVGDPGVNTATGIIINSGQDDLYTMRNVTVTGNSVSFGSSYGILLEGVAYFVVANNQLRNNHNWTSPISNGPEIIIRSHSVTATPSASGIITGNTLINSGATDARATVGIYLFDVTITGIHIGPNAIEGLTNPFLSAATTGSIIWHGIDHVATLPAHHASYKGRQVYETTRGIWAENTGAKWSSIAPLAWCTFDGTDSDPITILDGHNVTNVSKGGTGSYTVNLSITLSNTNTAPFVTTSGREVQAGVPTTTTVAIATRDSAGTAADASRITFILFGTP